FPFLLLAITLGGVLIEQVSAAYVVLLAYALCVYSFALLCSVLRPTPGSAARWTVGLLGLFLLLPLLVSVFVRKLPSSWQLASLTFDKLLGDSSIVVAVFSATSSRFRANSILFPMAVNAAVSVILIVIAWLSFERLTRHEQPVGGRRGVGPILDRLLL